MFSIIGVNDAFGARLSLQRNNNPIPEPIKKISPPKLYIDLGKTTVFTPYEYSHIGEATVANNGMYSQNTLKFYEYRAKAFKPEQKNSTINNMLNQIEPHNWL
jgi:hypothetical protein